jgi:hypothetical protein
MRIETAPFDVTQHGMITVQMMKRLPRRDAVYNLGLVRRRRRRFGQFDQVSPSAVWVDQSMQLPLFVAFGKAVFVETCHELQIAIP